MTWAFRPGLGEAVGGRAGRCDRRSRDHGFRIRHRLVRLSAELRVTHFEISHFPKMAEDRYDRKRAGLLGRKSFAPHLDDDVTVQAKLSEPAYSYLIAFRPDGTDELCDPADEAMPPPPRQEPMYPPPSKPNKRYRLSEGTGLYAFALVVSRKPLPPYREWKQLTRIDGLVGGAAQRGWGRLARRRRGTSAARRREPLRHPGQGCRARGDSKSRS